MFNVMIETYKPTVPIVLVQSNLLKRIKIKHVNPFHLESLMAAILNLILFYVPSSPSKPISRNWPPINNKFWKSLL